MPDINREASEFWNSLKPMIDEEIKAQTRGMVQRRKMKVTTAPSLNTNKIGVTEPFGTEMLIPFTTNLISATVGDVVWVEFMYGLTNAFASMFASADEKDWDVAGDLSVVGNAGIGGNLGVSGATSLQNTTVNGVLDVTKRRCYADLPSAGWYRVLTINEIGNAGWGFIIDLNIIRAYDHDDNEIHAIKLQGLFNNFSFTSEDSKSNTQIIKRIRYTKNSNNAGHVDIYYDGASTNSVCVDFAVHAYATRQANFVAESLQSVAASPSGETVQTLYNFDATARCGIVSITTDVTVGNTGFAQIVGYTKAQYVPLSVTTAKSDAHVFFTGASASIWVRVVNSDGSYPAGQTVNITATFLKLS